MGAVSQTIAQPRPFCVYQACYSLGRWTSVASLVAFYYCTHLTAAQVKLVCPAPSDEYIVECPAPATVDQEQNEEWGYEVRKRSGSVMQGGS